MGKNFTNQEQETLKKMQKANIIWMKIVNMYGQS